MSILKINSGPRGYFQGSLPWTSQPQYPVEVDPTHWLGQYCIGAWVPGGSRMLDVSRYRNHATLKAGTAYTKASSAGGGALGQVTDGTAYYEAPFQAQYGLPNCTITIARVKYSAAATTDESIFGQDYAGNKE